MAEQMLNLWTILDMLTKSTISDMNSQLLYESRIVNDLLNPRRNAGGIPTGYNANQPGILPTKVTPILFIDHVESLDEDQQVMNLHGGMLFMWHDPRLKWNMTAYGGVREVSKTRSSYRAIDREMYMPKIHITELFSRTADLLKLEGTEISFTDSGDVVAKTRVQIHSSCHFLFDAYPHDKQNCSFSLYSPNTIDVFEFTEEGGFSKSARQDTFSGVPPIVDVADFYLSDIETRMIYLLPGSKIIETPKSNYPKRMIRTVYWFNLIFTRHNLYYTPRMAIPLFTISTCTYLVGLVNTFNGLIWLLLLTAVQVMNGAELVESLPPDYVSTPTIGWLATSIFFQTMCLIFWRVAALTMTQQRYKDQKLNVRMHYIEMTLRVAVPALILYNYYRLF